MFGWVNTCQGLRGLGFCLLLALSAEAETLDGLKLGQTFEPSGWKRMASGYQRDRTRVELKGSRVVAIWGHHLNLDSGKQLQDGDNMARVQALLGKPEQTLYGCGREGQQVMFYDARGLQITLLNNRVTQLRLFQSGHP